MRLEQVLEKSRSKLGDVMNDIVVARAKGDLSENGEYKAAKEAQANLEAHISDLDNYLKLTEVWSPSKPPKKVEYGAKVTLDITSKIGQTSKTERKSYIILGSKESSPEKGSLSVLSPLYRAMFKKEEDDEFDFGPKTYRIISIAKPTEEELMASIDVADMTIY